MNGQQVRVKLSTSTVLDMKNNGQRVARVHLVAELPDGARVIGEATAEFQLRDHLGVIGQALSRLAAQLPQEIIGADGAPLNPTLGDGAEGAGN